MVMMSDLGRGTKLFLKLAHNLGKRVVTGINLVERKILPIGEAAPDMIIDTAVKLSGGPSKIPFAPARVERLASGIDPEFAQEYRPPRSARAH